MPAVVRDIALPPFPVTCRFANPIQFKDEFVNRIFPTILVGRIFGELIDPVPETPTKYVLAGIVKFSVYTPDDRIMLTFVAIPVLYIWL